MRRLAAVVACCTGGGIGYKGAMPWGRLKQDLRRFRRLTMGHTILMGRKTFESIGSKPLDGRRNVVVTKSPGRYPAAEHNEEFVVINDLDKAVNLPERTPEERYFVIGGAEVYESLLPLTSAIYMTRIDMECDADRFFPKIDLEEWREVNRERVNDEGVPLEFVDWVRAGGPENAIEKRGRKGLAETTPAQQAS